MEQNTEGKQKTEDKLEKIEAERICRMSGALREEGTMISRPRPQTYWLRQPSSSWPLVLVVGPIWMPDQEHGGELKMSRTVCVCRQNQSQSRTRLPRRRVSAE